ncbi:MAG: hypothetical protein WCH98_23445 [Verrucomicrobiota bacterium]
MLLRAAPGLLTLGFILGALSPATIAAWFGGRSLRQKPLSAVVAAKVKYLSVKFGMKRRRLVH